MASPADVRRLAAALPGVTDASTPDRLEITLDGKGFAWSWAERAHPKKPRLPRLEVLAVRCPLEVKALLLEAAPEIYFDEPHYRSFPAVLVRLAVIGDDELAERLRQGLASLAASRPRRRRPPAQT